MSENQDKVVALSTRRQAPSPFARLQTSLPAGEPAEQINAILERDDAEDFVKTINPHALFRLIKDAGLDQGMDLIPYTSPEQLQVFFDLDCWQKDRLNTDRMAAWLAIMVADADDGHFHRAIRDIDPEVISLFFKKNLLAVGLIEDGEIPEDMPDNAQLSPDNAYALVYPEDEDQAALMRALVDRLYEVDPGLAWTLFEAVRWELSSQMEETAYTFRTSRLEEFGFVERTEAMQVYATLDPVKVRERWDSGELEIKPVLTAPSTLDVPAVVTENIGEEFFIFRIINSLEDDDVHRLSAELAALTNRTMVADGIEPGEIETGKEVIRRTAGFLSLGLEFIARADEAIARRAVQTIALRTLFAVGHSITANLQQKARALQQRPTLSLVEGVLYSLLNPDEKALFEGLTDLRPTFASDRHTFDLFHTQDQVDRAALQIGMVALKQLWLFGVAGQTVEDLATMVYDGALLNEPDMVHFDAFFATALATHLLAGEPSIRGLTAEELRALPEALRGTPWGEDPLGYFEALIGPMLVELPAATTGLATRWLREVLNWLIEELAPVSSYIGPEPFLEIFLVSQGARS